MKSSISNSLNNISPLKVGAVYASFDKTSNITPLVELNTDSNAENGFKQVFELCERFSKKLPDTSQDCYTQKTNKKSGWAAYNFFEHKGKYYLALAPHQKGVTHHSSLTTEDGRVLCAGMVKINKNGKIIAIDQASGHYQPSPRHLQVFLRYLEENHSTLIENLNEICVRTSFFNRISIWFRNLPGFLQIFGQTTFRKSQDTGGKPISALEQFQQWEKAALTQKLRPHNAILMVLAWAVILAAPIMTWFLVAPWLAASMVAGKFLVIGLHHLLRRVPGLNPKKRAFTPYMVGGILAVYALVGLGYHLVLPQTIWLGQHMIAFAQMAAPYMAATASFGFGAAVLTYLILSKLGDWKFSKVKPLKRNKVSAMAAAVIGMAVGPCLAFTFASSAAIWVSLVCLALANVLACLVNVMTCQVIWYRPLEVAQAEVTTRSMELQGGRPKNSCWSCLKSLFCSQRSGLTKVAPA